jgi:bifunctional UDP-N-acetylglucosamine pyrophosphorylase/glucosamine-1-phosphate N-acetyltransferase
VSPIRPAAVLVLAAGEGTRMRSTTAKVLHRIGGRSLLGHAVAAARALDPAHLVVVVRHERDQVVAHVAEIDPEALIADQDEIKGTGRAVACGLAAVEAAGAKPLAGTVVVTYGDVPLLAPDTLRSLVARHEADGSAVTVLTAEVADPTGYGRVLRDAAGGVLGIVEHKDADAGQRVVREINSGIYAFDADVLTDALGRIGTDNVQGEMYLTDVLGIARADGRPVTAVRTDDVWQVEGVNDRVQLAALGAELNRRLLDAWMRAGVTVVDPASTWVDVGVELSPDVTLRPGTQLFGATRIASGATVGPDTTLVDCEVGAAADVVRTHGTGAVIGAGVTVGPFSFLRPGTVLGDHGKIGAYVETKNAVIGTGSKVPHLSYVGDAHIGEHTNIGAATVFVNYDGVRKHHTVVGDHVRIGSDNMLVAPVTIGDGAYTAAGSVIDSDVAPGALGVGRARQTTIDGWVERRRAGTASAEAAARARSRSADPRGTADSSGTRDRSGTADPSEMAETAGPGEDRAGMADGDARGTRRA